MNNPFLFEGEEGYEWPCKRCGKPFIPRRMERLNGSPFQQCCNDCQVKNLLEMVFAEDDPERES